MTIIAWDGEHLSADQRITFTRDDDEYTVDHGQKLIRYTGKLTIKDSPIAWIGMSGNLTNAHKFIGLLETAAAGEAADFTKTIGGQLSHPGITLILIMEDKSCAMLDFKIHKGLFLPRTAIKTKLPVIIGSGSKIYDLAYCLEIKDSRLLVQLGMFSDKGCGGTTTYVQVGDLTPKQYLFENQEGAKEALRKLAIILGLGMNIKPKDTAVTVADSELWEF